MTIPKQRLKTEPTKGQDDQRKLFSKAATYAKNVLLEPDMQVVYSARAGNGLTPYVLAMTDYLRPPEVREINTRDYEGKPGNKIHVDAWDDFEVKQVKVSILDAKGKEIEKGTCVFDPKTSRFDYTATIVVDILKGVEIIAVAFDYPDHAGSASVTL